MRLFVLIGGLLVAVLFTALIAPYFVDWSSYRDRFEAEASRILGQEVRVAGAASARLLPFPSVTFSDVRVGPVGAPNITIEQFSMDAELAPFLSGEVLIFDMHLVSPVIRLDLDSEGKPIWEWPSQAPMDPAQISLENAQFSDGTLILRDRANLRRWDFTSLNGTAAAQSLFGPWRLDGRGLVRGLPFDTHISTGNLDRSGFAVRVDAMLPAQNIEINTDGRVAPPSGDIASWYSGTFALKPIGENVSKYLAEGIFEADGRSIEVEQFRADFGDKEDPYTINGSASIAGGEVPRFDFSAKGNQVNITSGDTEGAPVALNARLQEIGAVISSLPFPPIAGNIDLDLPAIVLGQTTIRDATIKAEPEGDKWRVRSFSAKLPGRTIVEGNGVLAMGADNRFDGKLVVATLQPSGLASWLTDEVDDAIRLLPNAGFAADVSLSGENQSFENFELILGDAALEGRLLRTSTGENMPLIELSLNGENANFGALDALGSTLFGTDGSFRLADHDVDIDLKLQNAIYEDVKIGAIDSAMRIRGDRTEFDKLSLTDLFGASVSATGTLNRTADGDAVGRTVDIDGSILAADGAAFVIGLSKQAGDFSVLQKLAASASRDASAFRDMTLNIVGSTVLPSTGEIEGSASISGAIGGSDLSLTTTLQGDRVNTDTLVGSLMGTVENQEAAVLLSQAGFEIFPIRPLGNGQLKLNMSGSLSAGLSATYALETPDTMLNSQGVFKTELGVARYAGTGKVVTADAEPWLDLFGYIFPATGLGTPLKAEANIAYDNGSFTISNLAGDIAENTFSGFAKLSNISDGPKLEGELRVDALDSEFLANVLTGRYDLADKTALFAAPLYSDHNLDFKVEAKRFGTLQGGVDDAQMRLVYRDGSLSVRSLSGKAAGGTITGDLEAQNNAGTLLLNGQLALSDANLAALVPSLADKVEALGNLTLNFTGTGKSSEALIGALNGSGALSAKNITLPDINLDAVAPILTRADEVGYEITDNQIEEIARDEIVAGSVEIASIEMPVALASGVLSANNMSVALPALGLTGSAAYTLADDTISGNGRLSYDAGDASLAGSRPDVGVVFSQSDRDASVIVERDYTSLVSFVRQRALEREQARVEALQARLLEKQRLRREVRYLRYLDNERLAALEREKQRQIEEERRLAQAAQEAAAAEQLRLKQLEEAKIEAERVAQEKREEAARIAAEAAAARAAERSIVVPRANVGGQNKPKTIDPSKLNGQLAPVVQGVPIFEDLDLNLGN